MINRAAIIVKYLEPMVQWINAADPHDDDPDFTTERLIQERTVYLVAEEVAASGEDSVNRLIDANYKVLFEDELANWYTNPRLWPEDRSLRRFREWFAVEHHSCIVDTVGGKIRDDGV